MEPDEVTTHAIGPSGGGLTPRYKDAETATPETPARAAAGYEAPRLTQLPARNGNRCTRGGHSARPADG